MKLSTIVSRINVYHEQAPRHNIRFEVWWKSTKVSRQIMVPSRLNPMNIKLLAYIMAVNVRPKKTWYSNIWCHRNSQVYITYVASVNPEDPIYTTQPREPALIFTATHSVTHKTREVAAGNMTTTMTKIIDNNNHIKIFELKADIQAI